MHIKQTLMEAKEKGVYLNYEKFIAELCFKWNTTRRTIVEHLNLLVVTERATREMYNSEKVIVWK